MGTQKTATRLHARLLQEPERCRDSQRALCPGVLGCWFLAGVYRGIDRLSGWIWLSATSLFSILPRASLLQEETRGASLAAGVGKRAEAAHGQPSLDKGSVPCAAGGMQDKGKSSGEGRNSPSCWCEVLWPLVCEALSLPAFSGKRKQPLSQRKASAQNSAASSHAGAESHKTRLVLQSQESPLLLPAHDCLGCSEERVKVAHVLSSLVKRTGFSLESCQPALDETSEQTELEVGFVVTHPPSYSSH